MEEPSKTEHSLPEVLVVRPHPAFMVAGENLFSSTKFRYLKAYESRLPLNEFLTTRARSVQAILSSGVEPLNADVLTLLPEVRLVVTTSVGVNQIDVGECRRRGIAIANVVDIFSADVADLAVGLLIDIMRKISAGNRYVQKGLWSIADDFPFGNKLGGKKVGIVGLGSIGYEVAKRLQAFDCCISYTSRKKKTHVSYTFYQDVYDLAIHSDALVVCCSLTARTHHMIDKRVLRALGKQGLVVNVGRGAIVDEHELVRCLVEGEIRGAGLDVFENEPHVPEQLYHLDNVVLSPHCAAFTPESLADLSQFVISNLEAFFARQPLLTEYIGVD